MKNKVKFKVNSIEEIKHFSSVLQKYKAEFDICSNRAVVDGKSILGCMSLNWSQIMELHIHARDSQEEYNVKKEIKEYTDRALIEMSKRKIYQL